MPARAWFFACAAFFGRDLWAGDGSSFQAPYTLPAAGRGTLVSVDAGDLDGDGALDLAAISSPREVGAYFQDPADRSAWVSLSFTVGIACSAVRAADADGDGRADLFIADVETGVIFLRSREGRSFKPPASIPATAGSASLALGDFDGDGALDLASASLKSAEVSILRGDGAGGFTLLGTLRGSREQVIEAADFDGDRRIDLLQGVGEGGLVPLRGAGDGSFVTLEAVKSFICIEQIAAVRRAGREERSSGADLNRDGRDDLAYACREFGFAGSAVSLGDGGFRPALGAAAGWGPDAVAAGDLDGDGNPDVAIASDWNSLIEIHRGNGDGSFRPPVRFGPAGGNSSSLLALDLDGDGRADLLSGLTVFWAAERREADRGGERFLVDGVALSGLGRTRSMAAADVDGDEFPDLLFPRTDRPAVDVFLNPLGKPAAGRRLEIPLSGKCAVFAAGDLDGDGVPDLAGTDEETGLARAVLLDPRGGAPRSEWALEAGPGPVAALLGSLDGAGTPDLIVVCRGPESHAAVFLGRGGGQFERTVTVPTIEAPIRAWLGELDGDGRPDLVVISATAAVRHAGGGGGDFGQPEVLHQDARVLLVDLAFGDLDGDGALDLVLADAKTWSLRVRWGGGSRGSASLELGLRGPPAALDLGDLDGDGRFDLTVSGASPRALSVFLNRGAAGFQEQSGYYGYGFANPVAGHRLVDLDGDGVPEAVAYSRWEAIILPGRAPPWSAGFRFLRGDSDGSGELSVTDVIRILERLFAGAPAPGCLEAADVDDSGSLDLTDAIDLLVHLFLGGQAPEPPYPRCGPDPTPDGLGCAASGGCA